ncbi:DNA-binding SARP family transcriptional activator [Nocardiopsis mwathae]|uniref:DNA-binding SARP family transcriptional activator n=1 Tax=Nocardiopsis mwathae TaxID=1472723 RepID=A0A7W9YLN8_9ACTN|nr:DNA-binding SARP family transcriptional activator [Nocardiopsis mwathae]
MLALLALNVDSSVSVDQLYSELWADRPPVSAQTTLQTYICQLRRSLGLSTGRNTGRGGPGSATDASPALLTRVGGYELRLPDRLAIDAYEFEHLARQARAQCRAGHVAAASATYRQALDRWRGSPLVDVIRGERLSAWSVRLEQQHQSVLEQRFEIELRLGHERAILDGLSAAVDAHPMHEGLAGQLMRAFQRCGRRPEALEVFRVLRDRLVTELGIEPSAALQQLHKDVLVDPGEAASVPRGGEPAAAPPARACSAPGPCLLPADTDGLVGRSAELAAVTSYLQAGGKGGDGLRIAEIHGPPGVGKTALAVRAAYRLRRHFPDGQLFLDMSEGGQGGIRFAEVLAAALESWGAPRANVRTRPADLALMFRSWTASRRVLIVADDVTVVSRLSEFLPAGTGSAVIATNRFRGRGLAAGRKVMVPRLSLEQMVELYAHAVGGRQAGDRMEAVRHLLDLCEGLPLTVRAIAGRLALRPDRSAEWLLDRLLHDRGLLLDVPAGTQSLLGTIAASHGHLSAPSRELLERLARDGRVHWQASDAVRGLKNTFAERLLEELIDAYLVEETFTAPDGPDPVAASEPVYTVPPLVRLAVERLRNDPGHGSESLIGHGSQDMNRKWLLPSA